MVAILWTIFKEFGLKHLLNYSVLANSHKRNATEYALLREKRLMDIVIERVLVSCQEQVNLK